MLEGIRCIDLTSEPQSEFMCYYDTLVRIDAVTIEGAVDVDVGHLDAAQIGQILFHPIDQLPLDLIACVGCDGNVMRHFPRLDAVRIGRIVCHDCRLPLRDPVYSASRAKLKPGDRSAGSRVSIDRVQVTADK